MVFANQVCVSVSQEQVEIQLSGGYSPAPPAVEFTPPAAAVESDGLGERYYTAAAVAAFGVGPAVLWGNEWWLLAAVSLLTIVVLLAAGVTADVEQERAERRARVRGRRASAQRSAYARKPARAHSSVLRP